MKLSVIFVHYSNGEMKSELGRLCFKQLKNTLKKGCELIAVNNGKLDKDWLIKADKYIDNSDNNSLGMARNKGFDASSGEFVCFMDNDVFVEKGWWQECIHLLEHFPDEKLLATPIHMGCHVYNKRHRAGKLGNHLLNYRSGAPCFILKRESFEEIGRFDENGIKGKVTAEWHDRKISKGYVNILTKRIKGHHLAL